MKKAAFLLLIILFSCSAFAQEEGQEAKFYIGLSFGTSYSIGDFEDTDITNPDAGFAKNGQKFDLYGGFFINEKVTLTATLRYQSFNTEVEDIIENFSAEDPNAAFTGSTEDWETYYLLLGAAYQIKLGPKFKFFPRLALGPLWVTTPGITVSAPPDGTFNPSFSRSSETGFGLGYEIGIGLRTDLGKHFSLMPTFTFSGGVVTVSDVVTITNRLEITGDYQPRIQSFNLGLSLAYRFY